MYPARAAAAGQDRRARCADAHAGAGRARTVRHCRHRFPDDDARPPDDLDEDPELDIDPGEFAAEFDDRPPPDPKDYREDVDDDAESVAAGVIGDVPSRAEIIAAANEMVRQHQTWSKP